ncbi:hypothetical protein ACNRDG_06170 [Ralstonia pseudosolanacearum]|uniref:hypothetical protein n=1 Tax=Ralstonia pseudosolanacearum TaxID=1310165 RepID=UPI003AAC892A
MTITIDRAALMLRVAELEAKARIWRAAAFDRLQKNHEGPRPLRALVIHAARTERRAT